MKISTADYEAWIANPLTKALKQSQPQREWVGLTDEHIERIYDRYGGDMMNCARAIERELREKNNV